MCRCWPPVSCCKSFEATARGPGVGPALHHPYGGQAGCAYQCLVEDILQMRVLADGGAGGQEGGEGFRTIEGQEAVGGGLSQACYARHGQGLVLVAGSLAAPGGAVDRERIVLYAQDRIVVVEQATTREGCHPLPGVGALAGAAFAQEQVAAALQADA